MRLDRRLIVALTALALAAGIAAAADASAKPAPRRAAISWAPAATATVHPGVQTYTDGAQCTANFVYTDGTSVYLGQAAHCSSQGAANETDGCTTKTLPEGTAVEVDGASRPGVMVYNSWARMQATPEKEDADTCAYNDLALIKLDAADVAKTNPSVPDFGGPTGVRATELQIGDTVESYGNSSLRFGLTPFSPKYGRSVGDDSGGWNHTVYTASPGIPGDSGSGFLDDSGKAFGVLSTVAIAPLPASNGVGDLARELAYAQSHGFAGLSLVNGTEPFTGGI
ncbi:MAG: hypothetical protein QOJ79_2600 [Actinomycetota bacterium]|nr:hypothetical protein [Actinomycetota bacterium]